MRAAASAVVLFVLAMATVVHAEDGGSVAAPRVAPPTIAVGINPLAMLTGRFGGDVLFFPTRRLALVASGHVLDTAEPHESGTDLYLGQTVPAFNTYDRGFGGELGWRLYFGKSTRTRWGGLFVGASALHGSYTFSYDGYSCDPHHTFARGAHCALPYGATGFAIDAGGTILTSRHFFVTLGAGFQVLRDSPTVDMEVHRRIERSILDEMLATPSLQTMLNGAGVRPRILVTVGFGH